MGSDFLFVMPSFTRGLARVVDLGATFSNVSYNHSDTPIEADARAIACDWRVVGGDLSAAIASVAAEALGEEAEDAEEEGQAEAEAEAAVY